MIFKQTIGALFSILLLVSCVLPSREILADEVVELDKVEITAMKSQRTLEGMPIRTMVISKEELQQIHAKTLDDALQYAPGISVQSIEGSSESGAGVSIQGLDASQVLIMVDGNPVAPNSGEMLDVVDISQILVGDVERIEIVKGGASALYGANAMGGVVNIVTQNPDKLLSLSADISAGNWGEKGEKEPVAKNSSILSASTKIQNFAAQVTANLIDQDGYDTTPDELGTDGWHGYKNNYSGKLGYQFNQNHQLTISPSIYRAETATYKLSQGIFKGLKENLATKKRDTLDVNYIGRVGELNYKFHYMRQTYNERLKGVFKNLNQDSKDRVYDFKVNHLIGFDHLINLDVEYRYEYLSQIDFGTDDPAPIVDNKSRNSYDVSLSDSWFINEDIELISAISMKNDDGFGTHYSPMVSFIYANNDWIDGRVNVRASIAEGYKAPSLKELYWRFDHGSILILGNPDLNPETSISTQIGFEFLTNDNSRFDFNIFNNSIKNLITEEKNAEKAKQYGKSTVEEKINVEKARTSGIDISYQKTFENMAFSTSYIYLDAIDEKTKKKLPKKSKDQIRLGVDFFNSSGLSLGIKYRFDSKQYTDDENSEYVNDHDVVDIKFNHQIINEFAWYMGVNNLFDKTPDTYTSSSGHSSDNNDVFSREPRFVYVGLRAKY